jgi:hypothetical protein
MFRKIKRTATKNIKKEAAYFALQNSSQRKPQRFEAKTRILRFICRTQLVSGCAQSGVG